MNYILILLFLIVNQNEATDDTSQKRRNINDSFDINIGAGYAVGTDHSSNNNPPNGSTNISFPKTHYSNPSKTSTTPHTTVRGPRILTNFTPQFGNPFSGRIKNYTESKSDTDFLDKDYYTAAPSNIHSYNSPSFLTPSDEHIKQANLVDFQKVLDKIEAKKPYSKVVQVIKVPAIYEIHLQSDKDDGISENHINVNPTGDVFWKNYFENKPNISIKYSDEYSKWLENNNMHRQESFTKDGEKYYDFSDTPIVTYENNLEDKPYDDKLKDDDILEPIINHHYNHFRKSPNTLRSDDEVKINYNSDFSNKPSWQIKDYPYNKKPYGTNDLKKQVFQSSYSVYEPKPISKPFNHKAVNIFGTGVRNSNPFKQNQAITEVDKPQALHEVPPPLLGRYPHPKYIDIQKVSETVSHPKLLPTPSTFNTHTNVKFNKFSTSTTKPIYKVNKNGSKFPYSSAKKERIIRPDVVPSSSHFSSYIKGNQNFIYGSKSERVLTPYEINIPVTPGSTMVTVTERPDNIGQNSVQNFQYSAKIKSNANSVSLDKPEGPNNKHINYHGQIVDVPQQNPKRTSENFQPHSNINSVPSQNGYHKAVPQKLTEDVSQNQNFQYPSFGDNNRHSFTSQKPEILTNELSSHYQEVVDMPYQTQKSITDIVSTTQSTDVSLSSGNTFASSTKRYEDNDHNLEQLKNKDRSPKSEDMSVSEATPIFRSKEDSRRRTFNMDLNSYTKNGFLGFFMNSENSRPPQRKNNAADYIIYITRKAMD